MRSSPSLASLAAVLAHLLLVLQGALDFAQRYMNNQTHAHAQ